MASQKAEEIKAKFSVGSKQHLSPAETRFWARLKRVYDGDLDAFDRPDEEIDDRTAEEQEEDAVIAQIEAQLAARAEAEKVAETVAIE